LNFSKYENDDDSGRDIGTLSTLRRPTTTDTVGPVHDAPTDVLLWSLKFNISDALLCANY